MTGMGLRQSHCWDKESWMLGADSGEPPVVTCMCCQAKLSVAGQCCQVATQRGQQVLAGRAVCGACAPHQSYSCQESFLEAG